MKLTDNGIEFESTGRHEYAHAGILGIGSDLEVSEGYDGGIPLENLESEEIIEMCNHMILLWQALKNKTSA